MKQKIRPLGNRIVIKPLEITKEERIVKGIEQPDSAIIFQRAQVVEVGNGEVATQTGVLIPMEIKKGNTVLFRRNGPALPLRMNGEEYLLMREPDIEAIL